MSEISPSSFALLFSLFEFEQLPNYPIIHFSANEDKVNIILVLNWKKIETNSLKYDFLIQIETKAIKSVKYLVAINIIIITSFEYLKSKYITVIT